MSSVQQNKKILSCQSVLLEGMAESQSWFDVIKQFPRRLKRFSKRRINYLLNWFRNGKIVSPSKRVESYSANEHFRAGQFVRVRTQEEIRATLNLWNHLKGCGFMEEMWQYCGTRHEILKPVERFLDERDYRVKKARGIVILKDVHCQGAIDFGRCDRNCYFFWREEWLERDGETGDHPSEIARE